MRYTIVKIYIIFQGLFSVNGEICKKMIVGNEQRQRIIYVLSSERWDEGDSLNIPDSVLNKPDTVNYKCLNCKNYTK